MANPGLVSLARHEPAMCILQAARQSALLVWDGYEMNVIGHEAIADQFYLVSLHP
jgi:hypothetical protein